VRWPDDPERACERIRDDTVYVLMADGGYDGDTLLGVYGSEEEAEEAGADWKPRPVFADYTWYVVPVKLDEAAAMRERVET
jgi:hypothetical protein